MFDSTSTLVSTSSTYHECIKCDDNVSKPPSVNSQLAVGKDYRGVVLKLLPGHYVQPFEE